MATRVRRPDKHCADDVCQFKLHEKLGLQWRSFVLHQAA